MRIINLTASAVRIRPSGRPEQTYEPSGYVARLRLGWDGAGSLAETTQETTRIIPHRSAEPLEVRLDTTDGGAVDMPRQADGVAYIVPPEVYVHLARADVLVPLPLYSSDGVHDALGSIGRTGTIMDGGEHRDTREPGDVIRIPGDPTRTRPRRRRRPATPDIAPHLSELARQYRSGERTL